jgi:hypothetical protein
MYSREIPLTFAIPDFWGKLWPAYLCDPLSIDLLVTGHAVAQLVEALRYKSEGRGFDSRWCIWNFH